MAFDESSEATPAGAGAGAGAGVGAGGIASQGGGTEALQRALQGDDGGASQGGSVEGSDGVQGITNAAALRFVLCRFTVALIY